jgi:hypothetical protein
MNMNVMSFLLGKTLTRDLGEERSTQLGLIAGLIPGMQGVLVTAIIGQRETPATTPPAPDPKGVDLILSSVPGSRNETPAWAGRSGTLREAAACS